MALILAIDCSDRACSVALGCRPAGDFNKAVSSVKDTEQTQTTKELYTDEARQHAQKLLPMYRQILSESVYQPSDIDAIAIASGPGSFTGLRIGFSFAQGIAFALKKPLIKVSSLHAMAVSRILSSIPLPTDSKHINLCLDARMGELYCAQFEINLAGDEAGDRTGCKLNRLKSDALIRIGEYDVTEDLSTSILLGSGFALEPFSGLKALEMDTSLGIRAKAVYEIGQTLFNQGKGISALGAEPVYLRRHTAWKNTRQQKQYQKTKQQ